MKKTAIEDKTISVLMDCGVNISSAGVKYIIEIMREISAEEKSIFEIPKIIGDVAERNGVKKSAVAGSINNQIKKIKENDAAMEKYFKNVTDTKLRNMIACLYYAISHQV